MIRLIFRYWFVSLGLPILAIGACQLVFAQPSQSQTVVRGARESQAFEARRVRVNMRSLSLRAAWSPGDPIREIPRRQNRTPGARIAAANLTALTRDPLLDQQERAAQGAAQRAFSTPALNLDGQGFSGAFPPDMVGDVGPTYYIQMLNSNAGALFTIHDKSDGSIQVGPTALSSLGAGECAAGKGDPIVLYDHLAQRWILSEFSDAGNRMCVYVSITADPTTGGWFAYEFQATSFPDYPKYAVWPDGYYVSTNESVPTVYVFDRTAMLAGQAATFQTMTAPSMSGFGFQALQPSDLDGNEAPSADSPNYYIRHRDDEVHNPAANDPSRDFLEIFEFDVDFSNAANSTLTGPFRIPIAEIDSDLCGLVSFSCFPQPGGPALDPLREVVMWRLQYRNSQQHETLVGSLVTDVNTQDRGGIRWFELRRRAPGGWELFQEGTYAPDDGNHRWMSSAAMDRDGNIALGYGIVGPNTPAGIRYTGRQASDPAGTMPQPEVTLVAGTGVSNSVRWGDYSSMNVDPVDDCTFWYTHQYAQSGLYSTRIGSFSFDSCAVPPPESLQTYSAKFLCGKSDESAVIRGAYATTVNIHNPNLSAVQFSKKAVIALSQRENRGQISNFVDEVLKPDEALGVDCRDIRGLFRSPVPDFIEGFLVLHVPGDQPELDVVGVYTAGAENTESVHLETVHPRRVQSAADKKADLVPIPDANGFFCRIEGSRLRVTVRNQGSAQAQESLTEVNFGSLGAITQATPALDADASTDLLFNIPSGCFSPDCPFKIMVDSKAQVEEESESNNSATDICIG